MRLATIDPHSHKVQTKLYQIPKFGLNTPKSKQDTAILKCQNLQRNVWLPAVAFIIAKTRIMFLTTDGYFFKLI